MADVILPHTISAGTEMKASEVQENDEALRDGINAIVPISGAVPGRLVWGWVSPDGTQREAGSGGWSSTRNATGKYTVSFTSAAAGTWMVFVSPNQSSTYLTPLMAGATSTQFAVWFATSDTHVLTDTQFFFIAVAVA